MKNWNGIMEILELNHFNKNNNLIYQEKNIKNIIHTTGEEFVLKVLFSGLEIPNYYYLGLDSRTNLSKQQEISDIFGLEPGQNYYSRQRTDSNNFSIIVSESGQIRADSPILAFKAVGGSWGPVNNIFLATGIGFNSILISSASLGRSITVADGETITMKMGMALSSC